ncbi:MAG: DUF1156 domain-containing protein [Magnetococcales bacterium]|nr:DUF1156 domain-containing protein [Magnetococcales bacterium]
MTDTPRLIEHAFPLKQTSLDSVHEKNVRHGHISTLHIWPARRPLAACRAALLATLLPDPGTPEGRRELCEKIGGKVIEKIERKKMPGGRTVERLKEETVGGVLHWHRERENAETLEWLSQEIKKAHGGRAPRVLDPFAGGGAIPLEAMRLGCEVTAADINPVAWFILKCTLEYPQRLAGKSLPLPGFILEDEDFMEAFYKAYPHLKGVTKKTKRQKAQELQKPLLPGFEGADTDQAPEADLAWQVRAWGRWVLAEARRELAHFYPTYADFEPLNQVTLMPYEPQEMRLVSAGMDDLNAEFSPYYLKDKNNPRWIAKPTVAYLWARTVPCKNCRATVPLLKTRWLCKKEGKRVLLTMVPNPDQSGVLFGVQTGVPTKGGNSAQRREHDKILGAGTMSKAGVKCPCCATILTMADLRLEGVSGNLGSINTAVVVDGQHGKEYRLPTALEIAMAQNAQEAAEEVFQSIPFSKPTEPLPSKEALGFRVPLYGFDQWGKLFTHRQLLSMGVLTRILRRFWSESLVSDPAWREGIAGCLALLIDKVADYNSTICTWHNSRELIGHTFARFAIPMTWDYAESATINEVGGSLSAHADWVARFVEHVLLIRNPIPPAVLCGSAIGTVLEGLDAIITDPPYYDAIPYSDAMDFFYVWLRRGLTGLSPALDAAFANPLAPKWDQENHDGELIDDASRHGNDGQASKQAYEAGMARAFQACHAALRPDGRLVVVFAHKHPDAWETLVFAIIQAGFIVDGSWPIQTEMGNRMRAMSSAALASSVWLVCKKRPLTAKVGWDTQVLKSMQEKITLRLREFWDAGIRGPDFVWAATGPALEAYSRHPIVKKANDPGAILSVGEFLILVRRMVVDFVVGRVLTGTQENSLNTERMDALTAYYLLHRHDFGMDETPIGACILYATACGLTDRELEANWQILMRAKGKPDLDGNDLEEEDPSADDEPDDEEKPEAGNLVKLRPWQMRKHRSMGYEAPGGQPVPLIDRIHRLMHLWQAGDVTILDQYLDVHGLRRHELFRRLLQSFIELAPQGSEERSLLERISNHLGSLGAVDDRQKSLSLDLPE